MKPRRKKQVSPYRFWSAIAEELPALTLPESPPDDLDELDELAEALRLAIDGLAYLRHVLEAQAAARAEQEEVAEAAPLQARTGTLKH
jgi:hypothetical protein